jgi:hypothetical protein
MLLIGLNSGLTSSASRQPPYRLARSVASATVMLHCTLSLGATACIDPHLSTSHRDLSFVVIKTTPLNDITKI